MFQEGSQSDCALTCNFYFIFISKSLNLIVEYRIICTCDIFVRRRERIIPGCIDCRKYLQILARKTYKLLQSFLHMGNIPCIIRLSIEVV